MKVHLITLAAFPYVSAESVHLAMFSKAMEEVSDFELVTPLKPWRVQTWGSSVEKQYGLNDQSFHRSKLLQFQPAGRGFIRAAVARAKRAGAIAYFRQSMALEEATRQKCLCALELHSLPNARDVDAIRRAFDGKLLLRIFIITEALKRDLVAVLGEQKIDSITVVAPDAADESKFIPNAIDSVGQVYVGYIGSVYPGKGAEVIVPLADHCPEISFQIYGADARDPALSKLGRLPPNISLCGRIPYTDVPNAMNGFQIALLPNQPQVIMANGEDIGKYTSPMKLFEYMAAGRAIVASDLPVIREVLRHGQDALLVPHDDIGAWADAVKLLVEQPDLRSRLAAEARRRLLEKYTYVARARRIVSELDLAARGTG